MTHHLPPRNGRHRLDYRPSKLSQASQWIHQRGHKISFSNISVPQLNLHHLIVQPSQLYRQCRIFLESPKSKLSRTIAEAEIALSQDAYMTVYTMVTDRRGRQYESRHYVNPDLAFKRMMLELGESFNVMAEQIRNKLFPAFEQVSEAFTNFAKTMEQSSFSIADGV
jgi:hypothetical protein